MKFVPLDREFLEIAEDDELDSAGRHMVARLSGHQTHWPDVLAVPRVVILAEAGSGKTQELRHRAKTLNEEGKYGFVVTIEDLADDGLKDSLDSRDDGLRFDEWHAGNQTGYFFLDSVDEARLVDKTLERALRKLSIELDGTLDRSHVVISCRVSDWLATADLDTVKRILPAPSKIEEPTKEKSDPQDFDPFAEDVGAGQEVATKETKPYRVYDLAPLDDHRITKFAEAFGVENPGAFLHAIVAADARMFAERPQDLVSFIGLWNQDGKLGTLTELYKFDLQVKLTEHNPKRAQRDELSHEKAREGVMSLAAAMTLCRKNTIILPDTPIDPERHADSIRVDEVLSDWTPQEIAALLRRPIFDPATFGRAKFHQRPVRDYLTALWLEKQLREGCPRRRIHSLIFAETYGERVGVPSMHNITPWLAGRDAPVLRWIEKNEPETLISGGDPATLPLPTKSRLLSRFAENYADQPNTGASFDPALLKRFATPDLAPHLVDLFQQYPDHRDLKELLLDIVRLGPIPDCADHALRLALSGDEDDGTRIHAIRALGTVGNEAHLKALVGLLTDEFVEQKPRLVGVICEEAFPHVLNVDDLLMIAEHSKNHPVRPVLGIGWFLRREVIETCPVEGRPHLLQGLLDLVKRKPHIAECADQEISIEYSWVAEAIYEIVMTLLSSEPFDIDFLGIIAEAVDVLERCNRSQIDSRHEFSNVGPLVNARTDLKRCLFVHCVTRAREVAAQRGEPEPKHIHDIHRWEWFWNLGEDDISWILEDLAATDVATTRNLLFTAALDTFRQAENPDNVEATIRKAIAGDGALEARLDEFVNHEEPEVLVRHRERMEEMRATRVEAARTKKENFNVWVQSLPENIAGIRSGDRFNDLFFLARLIGKKTNNRWGCSDWESLIPIVGEEAAVAARDGLMQCWRAYTPLLTYEREHRNQVEPGVIVGLAGLAIENETNPEWTTAIEPAEAVLAARYATLEMNGLPEWLGDLLEAHQDAVAGLLGEIIAVEMAVAADEAPFHEVLSCLPYTGADIRNRLASVVLDHLEDNEPPNAVVLDLAISIVMMSDTADKPRLAEVARARVAADIGNPEREFPWLSVLFYLDGASALGILRDRLDVLPADQQDAYVITLLNSLYPQHGQRFKFDQPDFETVAVLPHLIEIANAHVRLEEDNIHHGVYSPDSRDSAEHARGRLLGVLSDTPGADTYATLRGLCDDPHLEARSDRLRVLARRRAAEDSEFEAWAPPDIRAFEVLYERPPTTHRELFELALARLDDIKLDIEDGDFSVARRYGPGTDEEAVQLLVAGKLDEAARAVYTVVREEEVIDRKEPDICFHRADVAGRVPTEIKVADNWSGPDLEQGLKTQLIGQYLRDPDSRCGIYMLTYHGGKGHWEVGAERKRVKFNGLILHLQNLANEMARTSKVFDEIRVIGIDFTINRAD